MKFATIWAATVEVECPHCQGHQPDPDVGSFLWTVDQISKHAGKRVCVECDESFHLGVERPHITANGGQ